MTPLQTAKAINTRIVSRQHTARQPTPIPPTVPSPTPNPVIPAFAPRRAGGLPSYCGGGGGVGAWLEGTHSRPFHHHCLSSLNRGSLIVGATRPGVIVLKWAQTSQHSWSQSEQALTVPLDISA